ncbi:MAG: hypothetical protein KDC95_23350 [Planctomycetes bacterium]|nr:hypothetical protein [Planctomycetota bacterium]
MDFQRHSVRGPRYSILVQQADGSLSTHVAPVVRTYIGTVRGQPGAMASAVWRAAGKIFYHVVFEDGAEWQRTALL